MQVSDLYKVLLNAHGPQGKWWPGTEEEIFITAILTQNTNWKNVEAAMMKIKAVLGPCCSDGPDFFIKLHSLHFDELAEAIKPAGFYKLKASRLISLLEWLRTFDFSISELKKLETAELRESLLQVKGVGKETADSILLYALERPILPIDKYTIRLVHRVFGIRFKRYEEYQKFFDQHYPKSAELYQELHGLIVEHSKKFCAASPRCGGCPVEECMYRGSYVGTSPSEDRASEKVRTVIVSAT